MKFEFTHKAKEHYDFWQVNDPEILEKIHKLLESISDTPFKGLGKPEPLKHELKGFWSRRITGEHRLVYRISGKPGKDQICTVIQCRFHY